MSPHCSKLSIYLFFKCIGNSVLQRILQESFVFTPYYLLKTDNRLVAFIPIHLLNIYRNTILVFLLLYFYCFRIHRGRYPTPLAKVATAFQRTTFVISFIINKSLRSRDQKAMKKAETKEARRQMCHLPTMGQMAHQNT